SPASESSPRYPASFPTRRSSDLKFGLGTPATRAEIIEKLVKSELMERTGHALRVTPKGKQLLNLVNKELVSPKLTAKWEKQVLRSEEHTSELQSRFDLVCRLLLE